MELEEKLRRFMDWRNQLSAYRMALIIIGIDSNGGAPLQGADYRSRRRAVLVEAYEKLRSDDEMYDIICSLNENSQELSGGDLVREIELNYQMLQRERCVSPADKAAYDLVLAQSQRMWLKAKSEADFKSFVPYLEPVVEGYKSMIAKRSGTGRSEDTSIDDNAFGAGIPGDSRPEDTRLRAL